MTINLKTKHLLTIGLSSYTLGNENLCSTKICRQISVAALFLMIQIWTQLNYFSG